MSELKKCRACGVDYPLDGFYSSKVNKDGRVSYCKECYKRKVNAYSQQRNFPPKMEGMKMCRTCKLEFPVVVFGINHHLVDGRNSECKACVSKRIKDKNKDKMRVSNKRWKDKNKQKLLQYQRAWQAQNKDWMRRWKKEHYKNDENYKIACLLRGRILHALKGNAKHASTMELLGCSIEELKRYFEVRFVQGMSWQNHGEWHLDHIVPCAAFDLTSVDGQRKCFYYTNLQPLWAHDNLVKSAKVV